MPRGGKRPGAGRPRLANPVKLVEAVKRIWATLTPELQASIMQDLISANQDRQSKTKNGEAHQADTSNTSPERRDSRGQSNGVTQ